MNNQIPQSQKPYSERVLDPNEEYGNPEIKKYHIYAINEELRNPNCSVAVAIFRTFAMDYAQEDPNLFAELTTFFGCFYDELGNDNESEEEFRSRVPEIIREANEESKKLAEIEEIERHWVLPTLPKATVPEDFEG
jgi:hypothetical protein